MEHGSRSSFSFATEEGCIGCRVCEGSLFTPKIIKENRLRSKTPPQKIACGAQDDTRFLGGGAARLPEARPLTEERVVRPPLGVRDPTAGAGGFYTWCTVPWASGTRLLEFMTEGVTGPVLR